MLDRLNILLPPPKKVIHTSNNQHTAEHNHTPIHILHFRRIDDGEETRDASHADVKDGKSVNGDGESAEREAGGREGVAAEAFLEDAVRGVSGFGWEWEAEGV